MGVGESKEDTDRVFDTKTMYYDEHGNLRYGRPILLLLFLDFVFIRKFRRKVQYQNRRRVIAYNESG